MPFFTIITATFNAAAVLPRLLESLAGQSCRDFEVIIQDGASKDGTVGIAESFRARLPGLTLRSEPDNGIYDAWNKALEHVQGDWVLFLGADDQLYEPATLERALPVLRAAPEETRYVAGDLWLEGGQGAEPKFIPGGAEKAPGEMGRHMPVAHPALFHRAALFKAERFDAAFRISGDYEFVAKTWLKPEHGRPLGFAVTRMGQGGCSNNPALFAQMRQENQRIRKKYFYGHYLRVAFWEKKQAAKLAVKELCLKSGVGAAFWNFLKRLRRKFGKL